MSQKQKQKQKQRVSDTHSRPNSKRRKVGLNRHAILSRSGSLKSATVARDELRWKEVILPDRLDDAEGFFGLEEIDDVEVVRDEGGQKIRFRNLNAHVANADRDARDLPRPTSNDSSEPADEWSGFHDEQHDRGRSPARSTEAITCGQATVDPDKSTRKAGTDTDARTSKKPARPSHTELQGDLSFEVLRDGPGEDDVDVSAWSSLQLSRKMLGAIAGLNFQHPTPIQNAAIPRIQEGHDVVGKAVTGSGKTLAYGIPIIEHWLSISDKRETATTAVISSNPVALILSPTRELAHQLSKHLTDLAARGPDSLRIATVTGGLSIHKQQRQLDHADIIVATPGRLWEVINGSDGLIDRLKQIQFLVVDEADRLLSEGHFRELEAILDALDREVVNEDVDDHLTPVTKQMKKPRQTLVFSATFHKGLQQKLKMKTRGIGRDSLSKEQSMEYLMKKLAFQEARPKFIDVNPDDQMAMRLRESLLECGSMEKDLYLYALLMQHPKAKTLVFTNSISAVRRLVPLLLNLGLANVALHSVLVQKARLKSLESFSTDKNILVATDVAARGLDIKEIDLIVHYHVPRTANMYIHRSGRTARAEHAGRSIMLCSPDEVAEVTRLISKIHSNYDLDSLQIDRQLISRLRPRLDLAKKVTDAVLAKEKVGTQDDWLRKAADELGVDYESDEFAAEGPRNSRGRGAGKNKKRREAGATSKADLAAMRASLKEMLRKRINLGVSERYLAGGKVDMDAMLDGKDDVRFLGTKAPETR